jgi:hypothetical protein
MKAEVQADGSITVELGGDELRDIIVEYVARYGKLALPTVSAGRWRWERGESGPTMVLTVKSVPNGTRLDEARTRPTIRDGRRPA